MPDETSTPPADPQAPPSEPVSPPPEPVSEAPAEPPPQEAAPESTPPETPAQAEVSEPVPEPTPEPQTLEVHTEPPQSTSPTPHPATASAVAPTSIIGELLMKARAKIQARRRKKLDRIMDKLTEKGKITNDEVEKLLHVSDATATRYLDLLEKEGKIRQEGKTGKYVVYVKI